MRFGKCIAFIWIAFLLIGCASSTGGTIEVTREIEVISEVEVTRVVEVTREVEVISEAEVTRIVVATPTPEPTSTTAPPPEIQAYTFLTGTYDIQTLPTYSDEGVGVVVAGELSRFFAMPVIFHNNSGFTVARITTSVTASSSDGQLLGTADLSDWGPNVVPNGGFAIGRILFGPDADLPDDVVIEFDVDARNADDNEFENIRDLPIIEHNIVGGSIVGRLENIYDEEVDLISVTYVCFDAEGSLAVGGQGFVDQDTADAGDIVPFEVDLSGNEGQCNSYLISARGFGDF